MAIAQIGEGSQSFAMSTKNVICPLFSKQGSIKCSSIKYIELNWNRQTSVDVEWLALIKRAATLQIFTFNPCKLDFFMLRHVVVSCREYRFGVKTQKQGLILVERDLSNDVRRVTFYSPNFNIPLSHFIRLCKPGDAYRKALFVVTGIVFSRVLYFFPRACCCDRFYRILPLDVVRLPMNWSRNHTDPPRLFLPIVRRPIWSRGIGARLREWTEISWKVLVCSLISVNLGWNICT